MTNTMPYIFAVLASIVSGIITYFISKQQLSARMEELQLNNRHEVEKLMQQHAMDIENLKQKHAMEIEKMELSHKQTLEMKEKDMQGALSQQLVPMLATTLLNHPAAQKELGKIIASKK